MMDAVLSTHQRTHGAHSMISARDSLTCGDDTASSITGTWAPALSRQPSQLLSSPATSPATSPAASDAGSELDADEEDDDNGDGFEADKGLGRAHGLGSHIPENANENAIEGTPRLFGRSLDFAPLNLSAAAAFAGTRGLLAAQSGRRSDGGMAARGEGAASA